MNQEIHKAINSIRNEHCTILQYLNEDKSVELSVSQVKRLEQAKKGEIVLLMFPILRDNIEELMIYVKEKLIISELSPIQKGDKDILCHEKIEFKKTYKEDESFKIFKLSECTEDRIVRVQDLSIEQIQKITTMNPNVYNISNWNRAYKLDFRDWYNNQLKEQNINRIYEDNDYIFLIEVKV